MIIQKAQQQHISQLASNNVLLAKESEGLTIDIATSNAGVKAVVTDQTKGFYLIALEGKKIVGQLMITYEWSDWRNKQMWWIQSAYVHLQWRQKGVFTQLLHAVKERAQKDGIFELKLYVHIHNTRAISAYEEMKMQQAPYHIYQSEL